MLECCNAMGTLITDSVADMSIEEVEKGRRTTEVQRIELSAPSTSGARTFRLQTTLGGVTEKTAVLQVPTSLDADDASVVGLDATMTTGLQALAQVESVNISLAAGDGFPKEEGGRRRWRWDVTFLALASGPVDVPDLLAVDCTNSTGHVSSDCTGAESGAEGVRLAATTLEAGGRVIAEIQRLTPNSDKPNFVLTQTSTTQPVTTNATQSEIRDALQALPALANASGGVTVTLEPLHTWLITFSTASTMHADFPALVAVPATGAMAAETSEEGRVGEADVDPRATPAPEAPAAPQCRRCTRP